MRGTVSLKAPSYLPTLSGAGSQRASLLATLHGYGGPDPATVNPIEALERAKSAETSQVALVAAKPQVKRDIAQFTQALETAETPAQLLANPAALKVLLTANGLGDQTGDPARATRTLLSDPAQVGSPAGKMTDTRWHNVTQIYAFAAKGLSVLKNPETVSAIANGYAEGLWRTNLDQTTPGLSTALDFEQRAPTITSVDQILDDPTFLVVITTALGLAEQAASQSSSAREQAISKRVDVTKFNDPEFVTQFIRRYLIAVREAATWTDGTAAGTALMTQGTETAGLVV